MMADVNNGRVRTGNRDSNIVGSVHSYFETTSFNAPVNKYSQTLRFLPPSTVMLLVERIRRVRLQGVGAQAISIGSIRGEVMYFQMSRIRYGNESYSQLLVR